MSYVQVRQFNPARMGTRPNYCLQNCRIAFDPVIPPKYEDARQAMQANVDAGTLHPMDTLPMNCAVPVFADTPSRWEHVMVSDKGLLYSDGKPVSFTDFKFFGWGESLNDCKVVDYVPDPEPEPVDEIKVGDTVDLIESIDYYGTSLIPELCHDCVVTQIVGDRVVVNSYDGDVLGAIKLDNLRKK